MKLPRRFAIACVLALPVMAAAPLPLLAQAAPVPKTNPMKVYAHYMPWFQTPQTLGANNWGYHWKMNTRNPNVIGPNGQRQIASHYYPLIGPYDSSDADVIEYHMLLMKTSGIDGVIIDWYGTQGTNGDIGSLLSASNTIISKVPNYGMKFAVCLEDRFAASTNDAKANVDYAKQNYFGNAAYIRAGTANKPLMPIFGPVQFHQPSQWTTIMSGAAGEQPSVLPLWYQSQEVGAPAKGEYAWIYQDQGTSNHLMHQQNFLATRSKNVDLAMGTAYPGFDDYYAEGGTGTNLNLYIPSNNGQTLNDLLALDLTYAANIDMVQLATFNDFGEGTMFEPTVETGYSYLQKIQQYTGVPYGLPELQLVKGLYDARKSFAGNAARQGMLTQTANHINQLDFSSARTSLAAASHPIWSASAGGNWQAPGNWSGSVPSGIGAAAAFGPAIAAPSTVFSDTALTVGTITFDSARTYVIGGAGTLTLQASTGSAAVNVLQGTHKINLPLTIASDTTLNVAGGATLKISDPVTVNAGKSVTRTGGGTMLLESTLNILSGGSFQLSPSNSATAQRIEGVALQGSAILDLNDSNLVTGTKYETIESLVKTARNGGAWNRPGISSTTARNNGSQSMNLGVMSGAQYASVVGDSGTFAGRAYANSDTLVKYTWNGDTNFSGTITLDDYQRTQLGFEKHLAGWVNGDFDYSGSIDFQDFALIDVAFNTQEDTLDRAIAYLTGDDRDVALHDAAMQMVAMHSDVFGQTYTAAFLSAVPEPTSLTVVLAAAAGMTLKRRRRP